MKWQVTLNDKQCTADASDSFAPGRPNEVRINDTTYLASWNARLGYLTLTDSKSGVNRNLQVRSIVKQRFAGESESTLTVDVWNKARGCTETLRMQIELFVPGTAKKQGSATTAGLKMRAPMTGKVLQVTVSEGQVVNAGDLLAVIEAMKMENKITAPRAGTVTKLNAKAGQNINVGQDILLLV